MLVVVNNKMTLVSNASYIESVIIIIHDEQTREGYFFENFYIYLMAWDVTNVIELYFVLHNKKNLLRNVKLNIFRFS